MGDQGLKVKSYFIFQNRMGTEDTSVVGKPRCKKQGQRHPFLDPPEKRRRACTLSVAMATSTRVLHCCVEAIGVWRATFDPHLRRATEGRKAREPLTTKGHPHLPLTSPPPSSSRYWFLVSELSSFNRPLASITGYNRVEEKGSLEGAAAGSR